MSADVDNVETGASDDARFFAEHGWVVIRGAVPRDRVAELAAAAELLLPVATARALALAEGIPQITEPSRRFAPLAAWLGERRPFELAARLLGVARVQLLQDSLLVKPPHSTAQLAWHQDGTFYGFMEPLVTASVRLALDPCTVASGCLHVLDKSHHAGLVARDRFGQSRVTDTRPEALRATAGGDAVPVELAPGDVSVHHACTFHASFANTTDHARRTLVAHVTSAAARLVRERLPPGVDASWFPTADDGRLSPERFPVLPTP